MAEYEIGGIPFHVSPVSIMQCWVGMGWGAKASKQDIDEYRCFTRKFFPFLIAQSWEMHIEQFCADGIAKMEAILTERGLASGFVKRFVERLRG
jgi:hypothetical protein